MVRRHLIQEPLGPTCPAGTAVLLRRCRILAPGDGNRETGMEEKGQFGNCEVFHRERRSTTGHNCRLSSLWIQSCKSNFLTSPGTP